MAQSEIQRFVQRTAQFLSLSLVLFLLDGLGVLKPIKFPVEISLNQISKIGEPVVDLIQAPMKAVRYYRTGTSRIVNLENQLAEALATQVKVETLQKENSDLRAMVNAPMPKDWNYIVAPVLGLQNQELVLGVGLADNVQVGDTVVYKEVLVGTIKTVSQRQSRVLLTTAPSSKVAVTVSNQNLDGLVAGTGEGLKLLQVLQSATIQTGQIVVSSGLDSIQPKLVVGKIISFETNSEGIFKEGDIQTPLDVTQLETVFIVKE